LPLASPTLLATLLILSPPLLLTGCGSSPKQGVVRIDDIGGAEPRVEPKARYGNMDSYVVFGRTYYPKATSRGHVERGIASWYGPKFHGRKTSSGERYDMHRMTAANNTLPLPTYALVTNLENGRHLIVRINDRGPFVGDRIIDLSYAAAKQLGMDKQGTAQVQVTSIDPRDHDGKVPKTLRFAEAELARYRAQQGAVGKAADDGRRPVRTGKASLAAHPVDRRADSDQTGSAGFAPAPAPALVPEARPAVASSGGGYYLQVGAFGARANAEEMRRRLHGQLAKPISIADAPAEGARSAALFRVRVGPLGSRADAERLADELAALGVGPSLVLPR
jgi:rare lipoprotein A